MDYFLPTTMTINGHKVTTERNPGESHVRVRINGAWIGDYSDPAMVARVISDATS